MRVDSTFGFVALQPPDWKPNDAEMAEELKKKAACADPYVRSSRNYYSLNDYHPTGQFPGTGTAVFHHRRQTPTAAATSSSTAA